MTIETKSDFYRVLSSAVTEAYIDKYGAVLKISRHG